MRRVVRRNDAPVRFDAEKQGDYKTIYETNAPNADDKFYAQIVTTPATPFWRGWQYQAHLKQLFATIFRRFGTTTSRWGNKAGEDVNNENPSKYDLFQAFSPRESPYCLYCMNNVLCTATYCLSPITAACFNPSAFRRSLIAFGYAISSNASSNSSKSSKLFGLP